jgi:pSer/pThr/pTyr-binding forkhead associated (FHA) protein
MFFGWEAGLKLTLKIVGGPSKGKMFTMDKTEIIIGRSKESSIQIPASKISKKHCRIWQEGDRLFVADMKSTNGTEVNGMKLEQDMPLRSGDRIKLPVVEFEVTYGEEIETQVALDELLLEIKDANAVDDTLEPLDDVDTLLSKKEDDDNMDIIEEMADDDILDLDELDDFNDDR